MGVGNESASALSATLTWLLRHGAGMGGQILFTWTQGSDLDNQCKKWRLLADLLNDTAMMLELSGPLWPQWSFQVRATLAATRLETCPKYGLHWQSVPVGKQFR